MSNKTIKHKSSSYNLTVEEAYKILTSSKMKKLKCNFKVKLDKPGGKTNHPRNSKPPRYFIEFQNQMFEFIKEQRKFNQFILNQLEKQGSTLNQIQNRLDNLVTKNNLKE